MTINRHIAVLAITATLAAPLWSQDLTGEVTVEREIIPVEREATPLTMLPRLSLPALSLPTLDFSTLGVRAPIAAKAGFAEPATRLDPTFANASRGYLDLSAGPLFNTSLSAGYRAVSNERTNVGVWLQYDSEVYSRRPRGASGSYRPYWRDHDAAAAVTLSHKLNLNSTLEAAVDYGFSRTNGYAPADGRYWVNANRAHAGAQWTRTTDALQTDIHATYGYFGYNPCGFGDIKGARQSTFTLGATGALSVGDAQWITLSLDLDMADPNNDKTFGVVSLTPAYRYTSERFRLTAGPRIDLSFKAGKAFHIAPEVKIGWNPNNMIGVELKAAGGEHVNTLESIALEARRTDPTVSYGMSHMPATFDLAVTLGPWRGAWVTLTGGWARANSWLMPTLSGDGLTAAAFAPCDISGFHAGVAAGADITRYATVEASWHTAPRNLDKGYYLWRDRARHVVDVSLTLRPLGRLDINIGWTLRTQRAIYTATTAYGTPNGDITTVDIFNLGNISDLSASARWRFSDKLSVALRATNLLDRNAFMLDSTPQRGITGMASVCWLFD